MAYDPVADGQTISIYNANASGGVPAAVAQPFGTPIVETIVSGTALQISASRGSHVYLDVNTSAALAIAIGPTSATAITINASQSDAIGFETIYLPAGWYIKLTGTVADFVATAVLM